MMSRASIELNRVFFPYVVGWILMWLVVGGSQVVGTRRAPEGRQLGLGLVDAQDVGASVMSQRSLHTLASRIAGGQNATLERYPYMGSLRNGVGRHICGAVLIHEKWAVTAAHCLNPSFLLSGHGKPTIILGTERLTANGEGIERLEFANMYIHEDFREREIKSGNDIALFELAEPSTSTPIVLPTAGSRPQGDVVALGWGATDTFLQQATLTIVSQQKCENTWSNVAPSIICAFNSSADTCFGDSGGPLIQLDPSETTPGSGSPHKDELVALTSFGDRDCTNFDKPGGYTLVSAHLEWIEEMTGLDFSHTESPDPPPDPPEDMQLCRTVEPKLPITITRNQCLLALGRIGTPTDCAEFAMQDFIMCADDLAVTEGCCSEGCSKVFENVSDECWKSITDVACKSMTDQVKNMLDVLSHRCDAKDRGGMCSEEPDAEDEGVEDCAQDECTATSEQLLAAVRKRDLERVKELLARGADIHVTTAWMDAALHEAVLGGHTEIVIVLLEAGARPDARDSYGETCLMSVAFTGDIDIARALIEYGARVNARAKTGMTALMIASWKGHKSIVELLIAEGAAVNARRNDGRSAWSLARTSEIKQLLEEAGARG